jgi:predicted AlkP superfamily pyrophosphatase or phosphodiesterase
MESTLKRCLNSFAFVVLICFGGAAISPRAQTQSRLPHHALLLISVDGMRPDYVTEAAAHGLKIPNLLEILHEGTYASGVRGVLPTVTYPSHTTILTGVWPSRHGIYLNTTFDPFNKNLDGWYWYSEDIRVPTLWEAAARSGLTVASVDWPASVSAPGVRYLIPEYWRANTPDDLKLLRALSTQGLLAGLQETLGPPIVGFDDAVGADRQRARYAAAILREKHPEFMTVHLAALDHLEHLTGPFSAESNATLEQIDGMVGDLETAMRSSYPDAAICVVSDHGFTRTNHRLHIMVPFVKEGLITIDAKTAAWSEPRVLDWTAMPWLDGGSAAVILRNPSDETARQKVETLLRRLSDDPANGIAKILSPKAIAAFGGTPAATFWVDMQSNYSLDKSFREPAVSEAGVGGSHGYSPDHPELRASFFLIGPNVPKGLSLGEIDMRSIAPTLAHYMEVPLPSADLQPLDVVAR